MRAKRHISGDEHRALEAPSRLPVVVPCFDSPTSPLEESTGSYLDALEEWESLYADTRGGE